MWNIEVVGVVEMCFSLAIDRFQPPVGTDGSSEMVCGGCGIAVTADNIVKRNYRCSNNFNNSSAKF